MSRPPRLAERILLWSLSATDRPAVAGDLAEEFAERESESGVRAARRWYWRQVRRSIFIYLGGAVRDGLLGGVMADLRDGLRSLRSTPALTVVALTILALGIGASTAVFSVVDAVMLRRLPFPQADRLVLLSAPPKTARQATSVTPQDFADWNARQDMFDGLAATAYIGGFTIRGGGAVEDLSVVRATASLFAVLQVAPQLGQPFAQVNQLPGNERVAVISDSLWRRWFAANPAVVGTTMTLDNGSWRILGVMPRGFSYPLTDVRPAEMWVPYVVGDDEKVRGPRFNAYLTAIGRLKRGTTAEQAQTRLATLTAGLAAQYPNWFKGRDVSVTPLFDTFVGTQVRSWMWLLLAAVSLVLLIACVNVANLLLVRAAVRSQQLRIRAALGATRWRLARALLVESVMLSIFGTAIGVVLSYWGVEILRQTLPPRLPRAATIAVDFRVLVIAALSSVVTGIAFGVLPALQWSRPDVADALREAPRLATTSAARQSWLSALVVIEVALAMVLLVGAGLFTSSFAAITRIDLGLEYDRVIAIHVVPKIGTGGGAAPDTALSQVQRLGDDVVPRLRQLPGVASAAAFSGGLPLSGSTYRSGVTVADLEFRGDDSVDVHRVTPDYLSVLGVPVLRGRSLLAADNVTGAQPVALINETAARRYFGGRDPLGATMLINLSAFAVIGVARDVRLGGPEAVIRPEAYIALEPNKLNTAYAAYLVVKTSRDGAATLPALKAAIWSVAPDLSVPEAQTLADYLGRLVSQRKFNMLIVGLFGVVALVIAAVGLYGVLGFAVEQRRGEIGIRMALGADRQGVLFLVLRRAAVLVAAGIALGMGSSWWLARLLGQFLFRVNPHDLSVYTASVSVLLIAGLLAALVPARRASTIDPLNSLRA